MQRGPSGQAYIADRRVGSGKSTIERFCGNYAADSGYHLLDRGGGSLAASGCELFISYMTVREEAARGRTDHDLVFRRAGSAVKRSLTCLPLAGGKCDGSYLRYPERGVYDLIVLDEPFAGLDEDARCFVRRLIETRRDAVMVIISHDITSLPRIDQLVAMEAGTMKRIGQVPECLQDWNEAPVLIRYLRKNGVCPAGLSREDLEEALCRIRG
jgi:hypothetical protein